MLEEGCSSAIRNVFFISFFVTKMSFSTPFGFVQEEAEHAAITKAKELKSAVNLEKAEGKLKESERKASKAIVNEIDANDKLESEARLWTFNFVDFKYLNDQFLQDAHKHLYTYYEPKTQSSGRLC